MLRLHPGKLVRRGVHTPLLLLLLERIQPIPLNFKLVTGIQVFIPSRLIVKNILRVELILHAALSELLLLLVLRPLLTDRHRVPHTQYLSHFTLFFLLLLVDAVQIQVELPAGVLLCRSHSTTARLV